MTNGEKIQHDFECEVCEPIIEDNTIHVIFADKSDSAIGFDWDWWNAEYKEPTTKNDLVVDCIDRNEQILISILMRLSKDYAISYLQDYIQKNGPLSNEAGDQVKKILEEEES